MRKRYRMFQGAVLLAGLCCLFRPAAAQGLTVDPDIIDGDSLKIDFRLFGFDAPEGKQRCERAGECYPCGREAAAYLSALVKNGTVRCIPTGKSSYGRPVAICRVGRTDIGEAMLEAGWGIVTPHVERERPDMLERYEKAQKQAMSLQAGVWAGEFIEPYLWRNGDRVACEETD